MNKYHNKKIAYAGEMFDSRKELNRYIELLLLQKAGKISGLRRQVKFELIPAIRDAQGMPAERACCYIADYVYTENGKTVVEDVKGIRTDVYKIKRKLMLWVHGIQIREV